MKLKKGLGVLMCCMAVIGGISLGGIHTEAALICDHTYLQLESEMFKESSHDSAGHYDVYGDKLSCPRCGYVRWENLHTKRTTNHEFSFVLLNGKYVERCSICGCFK